MQDKFDKEQLEQLVRQCIARLPDVVSGTREEIGKHLRASIEPLLHKMKLVSREEYDIQVALLERLRKRVDELEKRLDDE